MTYSPYAIHTKAWKSALRMEICSEMQYNEFHCLYDTHHKVSPIPNRHLNASNSVKHEDMKLQLIVRNIK